MNTRRRYQPIILSLITVLGSQAQTMHEPWMDVGRPIDLEAAGMKNVKTYDNDCYPGMAIHEMGTARMGRDPKTSVLNGFNQVWDAPNVFITDGAAMTSASCVNPSLTYMALTARAAAYAVDALKKGEL